MVNRFFSAAWGLADVHGWTDNALLHALIDALEREPHDVQDRILALLDEDEE